MNTKFDVGQRVTYPVTVRHEAKIDSIQVGKDGTTRYSVGGRMVLELELKEVGVVFEKPAHTPDRPVEPVKLYCVKSYEPGEWLTKGKIYELRANGTVETDDGYRTTLDDLLLGGLPFSKHFCKLVRRPAKVGEWVYVLDRGISGYEEKRIYKAFDTGSDSCVWFAKDYKGNIPKENYLVLDGYHGGSE